MKILLSFLLIICIGLAGGSFFFFQKNTQLDTQLREAKNLLSNVVDEVNRLREEKKKIAQEKERLRIDTLSQVTLTTKIQQEKEELQKDLDKAQKIINTKEAEIQRKEKQLNNLKEKVLVEGEEKMGNLAKKNEELQSEISSLKQQLKQERQAYYYNLGVAYAKLELYPKAIKAYQKSLEIEPENPDAHYNLGVLYESIGEEPSKAIFHYSKYLELNPEASDKQEVKEKIESIKLGW